MRWGPIPFYVALTLVAACGSKRGEFQPTSLAFGEIYIGDERSIDLSVFTLNGQRLTDPSFALDLSGDTDNFRLAGGGPLAAPPVLVFHPVLTGDQHQTLFVKVGGETYNVPVTGRAKGHPACPDPGPCHRVTFNFAEEKCVDERLPNGSPCGPSDCEGDQVCDDNVGCTYIIRKDPPPPVCRQDVASVTLQPAWTYEADPDREVIFNGLADAEGNLYASDCAPGGTEWPCDIVSLTPDGQRRWRIPASALLYPYLLDLAIIGERLIVSHPQHGPTTMQAFRLSDGSLAWQREGLHELVPAGSGSAAAVLDNRDVAGNAAVVFLDMGTGAELKRLDDVILGATTGATASDGQGTLYMNSASRTQDSIPVNDVLSAVSQEQGLLWRATITGFEDPWATDGTHLFMGRTQQVRATTDGQPLYADPGLGCVNLAQQAIYTTERDPRLVPDCGDANVRRLGLNDGVQQSSCRVRDNDVPLQILTPLVPTRDGGTVFVTGEQSFEHNPITKAALRWNDADGSATYVAQLDGLVFPGAVSGLGTAAIVKGRWVIPGHVAGGQSAILAYDVPGLALAEHGWMADGSQARNAAPW